MTFEPSFFPVIHLFLNLKSMKSLPIRIFVLRVLISLGILEFVYSQYNMYISTTIYTSMNGVLLWGRGL